MKYLIHHGYNENKVSQATRNARWSDYRTRSWLSATQVWSWDNGNCDAIVVVTGTGRDVVNRIVMRIGDKVVFCEGCINKAMSDMGFDPDEYRVVSESEA
jgi:hypothetical protein